MINKYINKPVRQLPDSSSTKLEDRCRPGLEVTSFGWIVGQ